MQEPRGDCALAARYFRAAGYASGRYEGDETVQLVGFNVDPDKAVAYVGLQPGDQLGGRARRAERLHRQLDFNFTSLR